MLGKTSVPFTGAYNNNRKKTKGRNRQVVKFPNFIIKKDKNGKEIKLPHRFAGRTRLISHKPFRG